MKDPPIYDTNARVYSHHFIEQEFVSCAVEGFGPKRPTLKADAVLTVFCFSQPTKHRKLTEVIEARALHRSIVDDLLAGLSTVSQSGSEESQPATRVIGIQFG